MSFRPRNSEVYGPVETVVVTMQYMFSDTTGGSVYRNQLECIGQYVVGCFVTNTKWVDTPSLEKPFPLDL